MTVVASHLVTEVSVSCADETLAGLLAVRDAATQAGKRLVGLDELNSVSSHGSIPLQQHTPVDAVPLPHRPFSILLRIDHPATA